MLRCTKCEEILDSDFIEFVDVEGEDFCEQCYTEIVEEAKLE